MSDCFDLGKSWSRIGWIGGLGLFDAMSSLVREPFSSLLRCPGRSRHEFCLRQQPEVQLRSACIMSAQLWSGFSRGWGPGGLPRLPLRSPDIITPASEGSSPRGLPFPNSRRPVLWLGCLPPPPVRITKCGESSKDRRPLPQLSSRIGTPTPPSASSNLTACHQEHLTRFPLCICSLALTTAQLPSY